MSLAKRALFSSSAPTERISILFLAFEENKAFALDKKRLFQSVAAGFGMVLPAKGPDCSGEIGQAPANMGDRRLVMELKTSRPNFLFQSIFGF